MLATKTLWKKNRFLQSPSKCVKRAFPDVVAIPVCRDFVLLFDKLKEAKYYKKNNRFLEFYNVKYFKEIKRLRSLQKTDAPLEPKRASTVELFCENIERLTIFT